MNALTTLIPQIEEALANVPSDQVPSVLGELERLRAGLWARLVTPASTAKSHHASHSEPDKLLTPGQAAALLNVKVAWLYRNRRRLPFARKLSRKVLRFSEAGLHRWQATRKV